MSFAQRLLKQPNLERNSKNCSYVDLRFIFATSNLSEPVSYIASYDLNDRRKAMQPTNIKMQLFLHVNAILLDSSDVHDILQQVFECPFWVEYTNIFFHYKKKWLNNVFETNFKLFFHKEKNKYICFIFIFERLWSRGRCEELLTMI